MCIYIYIYVGGAFPTHGDFLHSYFDLVSRATHWSRYEIIQPQIIYMIQYIQTLCHVLHVKITDLRNVLVWSNILSHRAFECIVVICVFSFLTRFYTSAKFVGPEHGIGVERTTPRSATRASVASENRPTLACLLVCLLACMRLSSLCQERRKKERGREGSARGGG